MKWILITVLVLGGRAARDGEPPDRPSPEPVPAEVREKPQDDPTASYYGGVIGSAHDFSDRLGGPADACKACHVPHLQAIRPPRFPTTLPVAPARRLDERIGPVDTPRTFAPVVDFEQYRIPGQRRVFAPNQYTPGPTSLMCMGCHDGTVAPSMIGSSHALLAGVRAGFAVKADFVWRDHPIGVPYPPDRREYNPQSLLAERGVPLPAGQVECISCHDPHARSGHDNMLVMSNRGSVCLSCHRR